jgi:hypothetical protein
MNWFISQSINYLGCQADPIATSVGFEMVESWQQDPLEPGPMSK